MYGYMRHTMFVVDGTLDVIDSRVGHSAPFENLKPFFSRPCLQRIFNHAIECIPILNP